MSALQCDISTPFNLCGVNTFFSAQTEFDACDERLLLIGQMLDGSATPGQPVQVLSNEDALFGNDSMAASMVRFARTQAQFSDIWVLPIADFGTAGTTEVVFSNAATATLGETIPLVVNGQFYTIAFAPGDTDAMIAAAFAIAIDDPYLTVTSAGSTLTIASNNGGEVAGEISVLKDYAPLSVISSAQIGITITKTDGVGVPALESSLLNLGDEQFTFIANPYSDIASMQVMQSHLCDVWAPRIRVRAEAFTVMGGAAADVQAVAGSLSAPQIHLGYQFGNVTAPYDITAAFAAAAYSLMNSCNDPLTLSNAFTTEVLVGVATPVERLTLSDSDTISGDGISIIGVNANNETEVTTFNTTYTQTSQGVPDAAFQDGQNVARLRYISRYVEDRIAGNYGRHTIRGDNYSPRAGQSVATTWQIREFVRGLGVELSNRNLIENPQGWADAVDVQWDGGNSCVNILIEPNLVNKLCCINLYVNSSI